LITKLKFFFATDVHGSEICWKKFLNAAAFYKVDMVILGGDVTGKVMVPILEYQGYWELTLNGERVRLETRAELDDIQRKIRDRGSYPTVLAPDELDQLKTEDAVDQRFTLEMTRGLDRWLDMADGKLRGGEIPCILNGGNDDVWEIDDIIERSPCASFAEAKVLDIGGFSLASCGWTNPEPSSSPWPLSCWPASWSRSAWRATPGCRSGASTAACSAPRSSSSSCWSPAGAASSRRSTARPAGSSA
jgi:uncharacterized protein